MVLARRARIRASLGLAFAGVALAPFLAEVAGLPLAVGLSVVLATFGVASFPTD